MRRLFAVIVMVVAAYLVAVPFALSLFSRSYDAEHLADRFRHFPFERFESNMKIAVAGGTEFLDEALPSIAEELDMSDDELDAYIEQDFPHVHRFRSQVPEVFALVVPASRQTIAQEDNVDKADDFPAPGVPVTVGPWGLLGAGVVLAAVGLWAWRRPNLFVTVLVLVAGLGLLVAPLVLEWPDKVDAAEDAAEVARIAFTPEVATAALDSTFQFDAAIFEMQEAFLPAIGRELNLTPERLDTFLEEEFPAVVSFLGEWEDNIYELAHELATAQFQYMDEFHNADATPYRALPWMFMAPGAVLLLAAGGVLLANRRQRAA